MPEMANLVYNMYMHMMQTSQMYRQVKTLITVFEAKSADASNDL